MKLQDLNKKESYNDNILVDGVEYTIGTNDGVTFEKVAYVGSAQMYGKKVLRFVTSKNQQLTINQSFHTFILEYEKGENNG